MGLERFERGRTGAGLLVIAGAFACAIGCAGRATQTRELGGADAGGAGGADAGRDGGGSTGTGGACSGDSCCEGNDPETTLQGKACNKPEDSCRAGPSICQATCNCRSDGEGALAWSCNALPCVK